MCNTNNLNESITYIQKCSINELEKKSVMDIFKVFISILLWSDQPEWQIREGFYCNNDFNILNDLIKINYTNSKY